MEDDALARFRTSYWSVVHSLDVLRIRVWEERELTLPQLRVLFLLRTNPGAVTSFIAARLGVTMSTVSGLVDKLVRAGLVERSQNPDDRRVVPLWLTAEGEALVGEVRQVNRAYLASLAESLGDDLEMVTQALERLEAAVRSMPVPREPGQVEVPI